jgi:DNA-binding MarR family transcriptional regulator
MLMTEPSGGVALRSVLRLHHVATSIIGAELKREFGLRVIDYLTLQRLRTSEAGTEPLGHIARDLACTRRRSRFAVERLHSRALVRRRVDPHDRRATLASLTDDGRALADAAAAALEKVNFGLPGLTAPQMRSLVNLIDRVTPS